MKLSTFKGADEVVVAESTLPPLVLLHGDVIQWQERLMRFGDVIA